MNILFDFIVMAMAISSLSITITRTEIFAELKQRLFSDLYWLNKLFKCPYCISHWISALFIAFYNPIDLDNVFLNFIVGVFSLVCLSSIFSGMIIKAFNVLPED